MKRLLTILSPFLLLVQAMPVSASSTVSPKNRLEAAENLLKKDNYKLVLDELKVACQGAEQDSPIFETSYLLGVAFYRNGNLDDAIEWLETSSRYQPLADYSMIHLGKVYLAKGDYDRAITVFSDLQARYPESRWDEEASFMYADIFFQRGSYKEAAIQFRKFINDHDKSPLVPKAQISLGKSLENLGEWTDAYSSYKLIWLTHPASSESKAASDSMKVLWSRDGIHPPTLEERLMRGKNLLANGGVRDAKEELALLIKEMDSSAYDKAIYDEAMIRLGDAYFRLRNDPLAITTFEKAIKGKPSPRLLEEANYYLGRSLQRTDRRSEAIKAYGKVIKDYPKGDFVADSILRLADMAEGDGDLSLAVRQYRKLYTEYPQSSAAENAMWREAWIYYRSGEIKKASATLEGLLSRYPSSRFCDTAMYWKGRMHERVGETEQAGSVYGRIIKRYPLSYYSTLSRNRLSSMGASYISEIDNLLARSEQGSYDVKDRYVSDRMKTGKSLLNLGLNEDASMEFSMAASKCKDRGLLIEIAKLLFQAGDYFRGQRIAINNMDMTSTSENQDMVYDIWSLAFPLGYREEIFSWAGEYSVDPYLIHAIIREESSYKLDAVSRAGAIGLMQLMPFTGENISKKVGFPNFTTHSLYQPDINISLGSYYIKKLIGDYDGNLRLAVASYNAGPNAVKVWISRYGIDDMDEFVENIPYPETRNYVKKVMRSYDLYQRLYGKTSPPYSFSRRE